MNKINMRFTDRDLYNLNQRLARRRSPERFRGYDRKRYEKDREKRLLLGKICYLKKQLKIMGLKEDIRLPSPYMSNLESIVKQSIEKNFPGFNFEKIRLSWLINPKTGARLELDLYCDLLKLAIEVQGKQHYEPVAKFDRTQNSFLDRLYRDQIKRETCAKNGVILLEFRYDDDVNDLIDAVSSFINMV